MVQPNVRDHFGSLLDVPATEGSRGGKFARLAAWRFDVEGDAHALFELPVAGTLDRDLARLSGAEREVARFAVAGLSNAEIAQKRGVSSRTVANQAASVFRKLGVTSRLGLCALMARSGSYGRVEAITRFVVTPLSAHLRAGGGLRQADPDEALRLWRGFVDGTWSLVGRYDSVGQRYVLTRRNAPGVLDPCALTQRERAVATLAAMGYQNKYIGYLLGLSASTVSSHLESVRRKLVLGSRAELIRWFAPLARASIAEPPRDDRMSECGPEPRN